MLPTCHLLRRSLSPCLLKRALSSSGPLVDIAVDNKGVATVTMQRLPVNSLNLDLLQELNTALDKLKTEKARGLILTSASPTVFSAGLDIMEMYKPEMKRLEAFWSTLQDVWIKLYGAPMPTAAAINGHAPAGGCLLAASCEYRAMAAGKYAIGLNETALGIVAPPWFQDTLRNTIATRHAELALTTGRMFAVDDALKVGLIDDIATDKADCIAKCQKFISQFDKISPAARSKTKEIFRSEPIMRLVKNKQNDIKLFMDVCLAPKTQQSLEMYLTALKAKAQKK